MAARKNKTELNENWREKIRVSMLMNRLKNHADGEIELSATQLKAIELILQRSVPTLSAVEQTVINPDDNLTQQDIEAKIEAILRAHPDITQRVLAAIARTKSGVAPAQQDATQQTSLPASAGLQQVK